MIEENPVQYYNDEELKPPYSLGQYKKLKLIAINEKTERLLFQTGFAYQGKQFSLGTAAESNLLALEVNAAALTYPQDYGAKDGTKLSLSNQTELMGLIQAALAAGLTVHASARALTDAVNAAVDKDGVDAVVDNR